MMRKVTLISYLFVLLVPAAPVQAQESGSYLNLILNLDREMAGLLDAYLEAIPECPVTAETPVRLWVLDVAWLRASAAINVAESFNTQSMNSENLREVWNCYLRSSREYLNLFSIIQRTYHDEILPESLLCVQLEEQLLEYDSLWSLDESILFELLAEEETL